MCWTCGAITAEKRLVASKGLSTQNKAERVKIVAAGSIFKIQSEILIVRIANKVFEFLWMDTLFQEVPVSLTACVPVGQSQKAGLSWVKNEYFFFNQALSKLVVIPVFKSSLIFINALPKHFTVFFMGVEEILPSPSPVVQRERNMQRNCVWLSGSEVHLGIPLGT